MGQLIHVLRIHAGHLLLLLHMTRNACSFFHAAPVPLPMSIQDVCLHQSL